MKKDNVYLHHILDSIVKINSYVSVGKDEFMSKEHWQDATIRQLEVIGEATKKLSQMLKDQHSDIPWRRIAGLRDVLIHDYMGVDILRVWLITQNELPSLEKKLLTIMNEKS